MTTTTHPTTIGRFAPSPTGPLHFGSLVTALGSYLLARQEGGQWLLRIEELDAPRVIPGVADDMLRTLEIPDFQWDGEVRPVLTRRFCTFVQNSFPTRKMQEKRDGFFSDFPTRK